MTINFQPSQYNPFDFANLRHIGPSKSEMRQMLDYIGLGDMDDLLDKTIPAHLRQQDALNFGQSHSERDALNYMHDVANKNEIYTSLIGMGYYGSMTPPSIIRNILENPAWYTAYTPYQPEISQGRLEALLNYQTMICDLTELDIANASLLDEATAAAEAMAMAKRTSKSKANAFFVDENCHPQNIAVMQTRAEPLGIEIIIGDPAAMQCETIFGAIFQYPGTYGDVHDYSDMIRSESVV